MREDDAPSPRRGALARLAELLAYAGGAIFVVIALMSVGSIVSRALWSRPLQGDYELVQYAGAVFVPLHGQGDLVLVAPICAGLLLVGFGIGIAWPGLVTRIYQNAPATEQDLAAGGMTTVQLFAIAFGTALAGMVANLAGLVTPGGVAGASAAALALAGVFAIAPLLALVVVARVLRLTGGRS